MPEYYRIVAVGSKFTVESQNYEGNWSRCEPGRLWNDVQGCMDYIESLMLQPELA